MFDKIADQLLRIPGATPLIRNLRWYEFRWETLGLDKEFKA